MSGFLDCHYVLGLLQETDRLAKPSHATTDDRDVEWLSVGEDMMIASPAL